MRDENVISWNLPNVITFVLMVALLWTGVGIVSHLVRGKTSPSKGVMADAAGNIYAMQ